MTIEKRQSEIARNNEELLRWQRKLFRAAREVEYRVKKQQRLLKPAAVPAKTKQEPLYKTLPPEQLKAARTMSKELNDVLPRLLGSKPAGGKPKQRRTPEDFRRDIAKK